MSNYENEIMNLLEGETPKEKHDFLVKSQQEFHVESMQNEMMCKELKSRDESDKLKDVLVEKILNYLFLTDELKNEFRKQWNLILTENEK